MFPKLSICIGELNGPKLTLLSLKASITGRPDIRLAEKIEPDISSVTVNNLPFKPSTVNTSEPVILLVSSNLANEPVEVDEPLILPTTFKVEPSNVRLASAFIASVPVDVRTRLFAPFVMKSETSTGNSGGGLNAPSAGLQQTIQAATGLGIDPADTMLKMAQAKLADTQANKLAGVDTVKTEAETSSLLAGIKNTEALTELKKVETRIANIDEWIKNRTKEDAADQIMWTAEKTMNEMNNAWREGLLSAAQFQDKVDLLKKELAGKIIDNELLGQKIKESKSNIEVNNTQIQKLTASCLLLL